MADDRPSERPIVGFRQDGDGAWIGELTCGHHQHVRHAPPLQPNQWVLSEEGRSSKIATTLRCRLCDQTLLPDTVTFIRTSATFDEHSVPRALQRRHRMARDAWGVIRVHDGRLSFVAETDPKLDVVIDHDTTQAIPPDVEHEIRLLGPVRFSIDYYSITPFTGNETGPVSRSH